jgi:hypothetical protein
MRFFFSENIYKMIALVPLIFIQCFFSKKFWLLQPFSAEWKGRLDKAEVKAFSIVRRLL